MLLFAITLAARLCLAPGLSSDDLTHVARIAAFQQREQLGFQGIAFGGDNVIAPRYWLAFWPLVAAVLSTLSDIQPLELTTNYLGALLGAVAALAVFNLARALGLSRRLAVVAVLAQLGGLLLATSRDQPGVLFFNRVAEDKFFAFFVLAPICMQMVLAYLDRPTLAKLARVALAWLALTLSHPTSLGMVALVVGAFCVLELLLAGRRAAVLVLVVIVPLTGAAALVRFVPHVYHQHVFFDVESAKQEKEITAGRKRRVSADSRHPLLRDRIRLGRRYRACRRRRGALALHCCARTGSAMRAFVLASLSVVASAVIPYTGWILGRLVTPFHLWRILCLVPYGIGAAFLVGVVQRHPAARRSSTPLASRGCVVGATVLLLAISHHAGQRVGARLASLQLRPDWQRSLLVSPDWQLPYPEVAELGRLLRAEAGAGAVVLASRSLNDLVPSLAASAELLTFRSTTQSMLHAGIPLAEARGRWEAQSAVIDGTTDVEQAARTLAAARVSLVLTGRDERWLQRIPDTLLPRTLVARVGAIELYRLGASGRPS